MQPVPRGQVRAKYTAKTKTLTGSGFKVARIPLDLSEVLQPVKPGTVIQGPGQPCPECNVPEYVQTGSRVLGEEMAVIFFTCLACGYEESEPFD